MVDIPCGSLGALLEQANLLTSEQSESIRAACQRENMTVGEFLYEARALPVELIRAGILTQLLLRDGLLTSDTAFKALQLVAEKNQSLETSLDELGWSRTYYEHTKLLGYLLVDSGALTKQVVDEAVDTAFKQGVRLSKVLTDRGSISSVSIEQILSMESFLQTEQITYETANKVLHMCMEKGIDLSDALSASNLPDLAKKARARWGQLLIAAELMTTEDLIPMIEQSLVQKTEVAEVLLSEKRFTPKEVEVLVGTQAKVHSEMMTVHQAVERFKSLKLPGVF
ncbi:MAG: hypothetical protein SGJ27_29705 [Candidatus Melainabacteria bacterium]|nr:hypothetical protein [Candidatus Melainabacteria bacterium]